MKNTTEIKKPIVDVEMVEVFEEIDPLTLDQKKCDPAYRYCWARSEKLDPTDQAKMKAYGYELDMKYSDGKPTEMGDLILWRITKERYQKRVEMIENKTKMQEGSVTSQFKSMGNKAQMHPEDTTKTENDSEFKKN
jgi:hypothetical protein